MVRKEIQCFWPNVTAGAPSDFATHSLLHSRLVIPSEPTSDPFGLLFTSHPLPP